MVGNDKGEILLVQRADSGVWLYPTGWADVGYSVSEVVVKEVHEETGIECEPVRLIAVLDGLRLGFTRVPMYLLMFHCEATGGELQRHPLECAAVGWFAEDDLPWPLAGAGFWADLAFAALRGEAGATSTSTRPTTQRPWRESASSRSGAELLEQRVDDRVIALGALPRVADRVVVDETAGVGRHAERFGARGGEHGRLDLGGAVDRERLEALPQLLGLGRRRLAGREREGDGREHLLGRHARRACGTGAPGAAATRPSRRRDRRRAATPVTR